VELAIRLPAKLVSIRTGIRVELPTFGDVARALNAEGIKGRRGRPWVSRTREQAAGPVYVCANCRPLSPRGAIDPR
jgi:hypothetical protein